MTPEIGRAGKEAGAKVQQSKGFRAFVGIGLVSYGVVHILIGWIALHLAWVGGGDASGQGALRQLAQQPFGTVLLWIVVAGFGFLVLWQAIEATTGHRDQEGRRRTLRRLGSAGRMIIYLALGVSAAGIATGSGGSSGQQEETVTSRLLGVPFGRVLVIIFGLAVVGTGIYLIIKGIARKFTSDLDGGVAPWVERLGLVGYTAKGVGIVLVGLLFGWAAITHDPKKAGGLDAALKTLRDQPLGTVLLTAMAVGLICFGLFCFVWSRNAKHEAQQQTGTSLGR